jgi:CO dehydrogenase/acetyl-CoA synthase beta subunit
MAGKIQLKLKKKEPAAAAPAVSSAGTAMPAAGPSFAMPAGGSGGIKLVLKDAKISIDKVVLAK